MPYESTQAAFNRIYDETCRDALVYLTAKCAQPADVADLLQETYVEVFTALQKRGAAYIQTPRAFVLRVARQKLSRHYGLLSRLHLAADRLDLEEAAAPPPDWIDDRLVDRELLERAGALLAGKPPAVQKIFRLHYGLELTLAQIANLLNLTQSDVKNKLYRTLAELCTQLKE